MTATLNLLNWVWWSNRSLLIGSVVSVLIAQIYFWIDIRDAELSNIAGFLLGISILVSVVSAFGVFTFGNELDLSSGRSAFPSWFLSLPANPSRFAIGPLVGLALLLGWAWWPYTLAMLHMGSLPGNEFVETSEPLLNRVWSFGLLPWLGLCGFGFWVQAIAWRPFRFAITRLLIFAALIFGLSVLLSFGAYFPWVNRIVLPLATCAGLLCAFRSVALARSSSWKADAGTTLGLRNFAAVRQTIDPEVARLDQFKQLEFRSPSKSFAWRDWKQLARIPVALMLMVALPMLCFVLTMETTLNMLMILLFPIMIGVATAPTMGKDRYWKSKAEMSPYLATLPVTNRELLLSRARCVVRNSLVMWAIAAIVLLVWFLSTGGRQLLKAFASGLGEISGAENGVPVFIALLFLQFLMTILTPWPGFAVGLCGRKKVDQVFLIVVTVLGLTGLLMLCIKALEVFQSLSSPPYAGNADLRIEYLNQLFGQVPFVLGSILVAKLCLGVLPVVLLMRRGLFNWKSFMQFLGTFALVALSLVGTCWMLLRGVDGIIQVLVYLIVIILIPFSSALMLPFSLDWNRHR